MSKNDDEGPLKRRKLLDAGSDGSDNSAINNAFKNEKKNEKPDIALPTFETSNGILAEGDERKTENTAEKSPQSSFVDDGSDSDGSIPDICID